MFFKGKSIFCIENFNNAIVEYTKCISLDKNFYKAYNNRGLCYKFLDNTDDALKDFDMTIQLAPEWYGGYYNKAKLLFDLEYYESSIEYWDKAILFNNSEAYSYYYRAEGYSRLNNFEMELKDSCKAIELKPDLYEAYTLMAMVKLQFDDYNGAIEDCDVAITHDAADGRTYGTRGSANFCLGNFTQALDDYTKCLSVANNENKAYLNHIIYCQRAFAYNELGKYQAAIKDCNKAIKMYSDYSYAYWVRGGAMYLSGKIEQAKNDYVTANELSGNKYVWYDEICMP